MTDQIRADEARRIALTAQGFSGRGRRSSDTAFTRVLQHLHVLQIDSVNVFARSHYLPFFSRHGPYKTDALDAFLWNGSAFTEYWAHEAAFIPVADRPLFAWRMDDFRDAHHRDGTLRRLDSAIASVRARLRDDGPQFVRDLEGPRQSKRGTWWDWSETKRAVEALFAHGEVVSAGRTGFQRQYALAEHVLNEEHLYAVPREEAQRQLIEQAARSHGIGTLADLADYHRITVREARVAVQALEDAGTLIPTRVDGWRGGDGQPLRAWRHTDAQLPARCAPDALLTPFDPVVWYRPRAERMFDFHYRIEIYTPKEKRVFGYYCLPLMVSGRLVGRIDLKADRQARVLRIQAAWQERRAPSRTAETAVRLLTQAAQWQGLETIQWSGTGNLTLPVSWTVEEATIDSVGHR